MFESGAMVNHILERHGAGRLRPAPGSAASALHHQWCWFSEATLIRPIGLNRILRQTGDGTSIADAGRHKAHEGLVVVDRAVTGAEFLLGAKFDAADVMMGYSLHLLERADLLDDRDPNAQAYLRRLRGRDGFQTTLSA